MVDRANLIAEAVSVELETVGAEGVRLDDVGAGSDVGPMDTFDESPIGDIEFIEALVEEHTQLVEPGPHRTVKYNNLLGENGKKVSFHVT